MKRMKKTLFMLALLSLLFVGGSAFSDDKKDTKKDTAKKSKTEKIVVAGKLFYSLKRRVVMPFRGTIERVSVITGKQVNQSQALIRYTLWPQTALDLRRRVSPVHLADVEMRLIDLENNLSKLEVKQNEIKQLAKHDMSPAHSLNQINREIELLREKLALGWNEEQIKEYFVAQYGDRVLATPPAAGLNWLVYVLPPAVILVGAVGLFRLFRSWSIKTDIEEPPPEIRREMSQDPYVARLEEELRRREGSEDV